MRQSKMTTGFVESIQRALRRRMYDVGTIDGDFGPATMEAMRRFLQGVYNVRDARYELFTTKGRMFIAYLNSLYDLKQPVEAPWLLWANRQIGLREFKGTLHNPRIIQMFHDIKAKWFTTDETPWCAAFVGSMLEQSGWKSTRSARARSYENWGVRMDKPVIGAVCVLSRGKNPKHGHVGFVTCHTNNTVTLLGGNQGDKVSYVSFPKSRVVGYYWPKGCPLPDPAVETKLDLDTPSNTKTD